ncbi:MAG: CRISPR-associated protein Cas4 [Desulfomonilaceae bacterium]
MFTEEEFLPISLLQHLLFCPRRAALVHIEGIWSDNIFTALGQNMHERVHTTEVESRRDLRVTRGLLLRSLTLGVTGKADVVEFQRLNELESNSASVDLRAIKLNGVRGLWRAYPVEYKSGHLRHEVGYEIQLCAQAICLEEMLGTHVTEGSIYYGKTGRRLDLVFDSQLRLATETACCQLHSVLNSDETPPAKYEPKCTKCSLLDFCLPKVMSQNRSVKSYMDKVVGSNEQDIL